MLSGAMTKVQVTYQLQAPLDERGLEALGGLNSVYGLAGVRLDEASNHLVVNYDASRLKLTDVDQALNRVGIAARRLES
jgi:hypothetical protein